MNRYKVTITLSNGNQVDAKVVAENQDKAIKRLQATKEFADFVGDAEIKSIDIEQIERKQSDDTRFLLQKSEKANHYVCTDKTNNIVAIFEKGKFNESQKITNLHKLRTKQMLQLPTILREMADWLQKYHKDKI